MLTTKAIELFITSPSIIILCQTAEKRVDVLGNGSWFISKKKKKEKR
jgi:hypothetical protein